jgi:PAS domain S-box-containing protein
MAQAAKILAEKWASRTYNAAPVDQARNTAVARGAGSLTEEQIRAGLREQNLRLLVSRIRMALWVLISARLVQASIDVRPHVAERFELTVAALLIFVAAGIALLALRRADSIRRATWIAVLASIAIWLGVGYSNVVREGASARLSVYMILYIGMAVFIPWGVWAQAISVLIAELTILAGIWWLGTLPGGIGLFESATVMTAGMSLYVAHRLERSRQALAERELERARAEEALRRSESMLLAMFDHMEDIFYRTDLRGQLEIVSPSVARYGYRAADLVGRTDASFYSDPTEHAAAMEVLYSVGTLSDYEVTMQKADGAAVQFSLSARLLRDAEGRPTGTEGLLRDISQRIRQQQHIAALLEVARDLSGTAELGEKLELVQRRTAALLPCDRVATFAWDAARRSYSVRTQSALRTELAMTGLEFTSETPLAEMLLLAHRVVIGSTHDTRWDELLAACRARAIAAIPLHVRGRPIGALLALQDRDGADFDAEQIDLLEGIACHLGVAIDAAQTLASVSPIGIFRTNAGGYVTYMNERCAELTGLNAGAGVGLPWMSCIHPDDRERVAAEHAASRLENTPFRSEYRLCTAGGAISWVLGQALADGNAGAARGYLCTLIDITERKRAEAALQESERRYRNIFSAAPVSIWEEDFSAIVARIERLRAAGVADLRTYLDAHPEVVREAAASVRIVDVNDATLQLFGARDKAELLISLPRVFLPETYDSFKEEIVAFANGTTLTSETCVQTLQGERRDVLFGIALAERDVANHVLVSIMDVTARKRAEQALTLADRAKQDAAHAAADTERRRVARELHDGVLQDLGATKLLLEVQHKRAPNPGAEQLLQRLRQSLVDIRGVVDDLRTPDPQLSLQDAIAAHARVLTARRPVTLELELDTGTVVDWAVRDLYRIAQEALANAVRHADPQQVSVVLTSDEHHTTLSIADDGAGFDPNTAPGGTGLLGIRERAASLGAELDISSAPGAGTVIRVIVPHGGEAAADHSKDEERLRSTG